MKTNALALYQTDSVNFDRLQAEEMKHIVLLTQVPQTSKPCAVQQGPVRYKSPKVWVFIG